MVSLPLGDRSFFTIGEDDPVHMTTIRTTTPPTMRIPVTQENGSPSSPGGSKRRKQLSGTSRLMRRKQVSLDMFGPDNDAFFKGLPEEAIEEGIGEILEEEVQPLVDEQGALIEKKKLILPLRFAPRLVVKSKAGGGHGGGHDSSEGLKDIEEEGSMEGKKDEIIYKVPPDDYIVRATRKDKIKALILFCIMTCFLGVCVGWSTHEDESHKLFGTVGNACVTPCYGGTEYRNFFKGGHDSFHHGDVSTCKFSFTL